MLTKERSVSDTVEAFKEAVSWFKNQIGPNNVTNLQERIDDLYRKAMRHGEAKIRRERNRYKAALKEIRKTFRESNSADHSPGMDRIAEDALRRRKN